MSRTCKLALVTHDPGLLEHWQRAFGKTNQIVATRLSDLNQGFFHNELHVTTVWVDLSLPEIPPWGNHSWSEWLHKNDVRLIAASSNPKDDEAIAALDTGFSAYCHAFSDGPTLRQIRQVVEAGHVWVGKSLMQRLLHSASRAAAVLQKPGDDWHAGLTAREREIAVLAANGASNHGIALSCNISERTVKAHLSAVFTKLNISDRLQLALRVHNIS